MNPNNSLKRNLRMRVSFIYKYMNGLIIYTYIQFKGLLLVNLLSAPFLNLIGKYNIHYEIM